MKLSWKFFEDWQFWKISFFKSAILNFFFWKKKKKMLHKKAKVSWLTRLGRNFDDYPGFQLIGVKSRQFKNRLSDFGSFLVILLLLTLLYWILLDTSVLFNIFKYSFIFWAVYSSFTYMENHGWIITLARKESLCPLNWGAQVSLKISSDE